MSKRSSFVWTHATPAACVSEFRRMPYTWAPFQSSPNVLAMASGPAIDAGGREGPHVVVGPEIRLLHEHASLHGPVGVRVLRQETQCDVVLDARLPLRHEHGALRRRQGLELVGDGPRRGGRVLGLSWRAGENACDASRSVPRSVVATRHMASSLACRLLQWFAAVSCSSDTTRILVYRQHAVVAVFRARDLANGVPAAVTMVCTDVRWSLSDVQQ